MKKFKTNFFLIDNQKGGCGKTTLTLNLGAAFKGKCGLVDTDGQGSLSKWAIDSDKEVLIADTKKDILNLRHTVTEFDNVLIDGHANVSDVSIEALKIADVVLIPVMPGWLDYDSTADYCEHVNRMKLERPKLKAYFVMNGDFKDFDLSRDLNELSEALEMPFLDTRVFHRRVFKRMTKTGLTVFDSNNRQAKSDMLNLASELIGTI